jgi:hypothetical protein
MANPLDGLKNAAKAIKGAASKGVEVVKKEVVEPVQTLKGVLKDTYAEKVMGAKSWQDWLAANQKPKRKTDA